MDDHQVKWGAILLFGSALFGWALIHFTIQQWHRKRERRRKGFRTMKSSAQRARDRARRNRPRN